MVDDRPSAWVAEQNEPKPWVGKTAGLLRQLASQPGRGVPLVPGQPVGELEAQQVGTTGGAVEQRPAGEDAGRSAVQVGDGEAEVGERVAGGVDDPHSHLAGLDHVPVAHRHPLVGDRVVGVDAVLRADLLSEAEAPGDVVVVDVGLEHVRDAQPTRLGDGQHSVDVALRVDHHGDRSVVSDIRTVTQRRGVQGDDLDHAVCLLSAPAGMCSGQHHIPPGVSMPPMYPRSQRGLAAPVASDPSEAIAADASDAAADAVADAAGRPRRPRQ